MLILEGVCLVFYLGGTFCNSLSSPPSLEIFGSHWSFPHPILPFPRICTYSTFFCCCFNPLPTFLIYNYCLESVGVCVGGIIVTISISLGGGGGGGHVLCVIGQRAYCNALNYETNVLYEICGNSLTYLLITMATCTSLTTRILASGSSVMTVTSYTSFSVMGMKSRSSLDQMVSVCMDVCVCYYQSTST